MVNAYQAIAVLKNGAAVPLDDYLLAPPAQDGSQAITAWNAAKLGAQPTAAQLAAVTADQVAAFYAAQAAAGAAALVQQVQDLTVAVHVGDILVGQRFNELIAWVNGTLIPAVNGLLTAAGKPALAAYAIAADVTTINPSPLTVAQGKADAANVLQKTTWATE